MFLLLGPCHGSSWEQDSQAFPSPAFLDSEVVHPSVFSADSSGSHSIWHLALFSVPDGPWAGIYSLTKCRAQRANLPHGASALGSQGRLTWFSWRWIQRTCVLPFYKRFLWLISVMFLWCSQQPVVHSGSQWSKQIEAVSVVPSVCSKQDRIQAHTLQQSRGRYYIKYCQIVVGNIVLRRDHFITIKILNSVHCLYWILL